MRFDVSQSKTGMGGAQQGPRRGIHPADLRLIEEALAQGELVPAFAQALERSRRRR